MSNEREKQTRPIPDQERRQIIKQLSIVIAIAAPSAKLVLANEQLRAREEY
jgi:hypothetical protein